MRKRSEESGGRNEVCERESRLPQRINIFVSLLLINQKDVGLDEGTDVVREDGPDERKDTVTTGGRRGWKTGYHRRESEKGTEKEEDQRFKNLPGSRVVPKRHRHK